MQNVPDVTVWILFPWLFRSKFIFVLEQRQRVSGLEMEFMKQSCHCAREVAVDGAWEKGPETFLKAQNANMYPHLPAPV